MPPLEATLRKRSANLYRIRKPASPWKVGLLILPAGIFEERWHVLYMEGRTKKSA